MSYYSMGMCFASAFKVLAASRKLHGYGKVSRAQSTQHQNVLQSDSQDNEITVLMYFLLSIAMVHSVPYSIKVPLPLY